MTTVNFSDDPTPLLTDLENRLEAVEDAEQIELDGTWTKWTTSVNMDGTVNVTVDFQPTNEQTINVPQTSPVSCTSGTLESLGTMTLAPGFVYEYYGAVSYTATGAGTQVVAVMTQALSSVAGPALPTSRNDYSTVPRGATLSAADQTNILPCATIDLTAATGPTTMTLLAKVSFAGGSGGVSAYGFARAVPRP